MAKDENAVSEMPAGEDARTSSTRDADARHAAGRPPTSEEERRADEAAGNPDVSGDQDDVARHYREMTARGAAQKGEGRVP